jgi:hypothetical protein
MLGPKQRQLASYVASADDGELEKASQQWNTAEGLLRRVSAQLGSRSTEIGSDHRFSGDTAKAAKTAFSQSSQKMADRADQLKEGSEAFRQAAHAVRQAKKASDGFAAHAGAQPPQQPPDLGDAAAQRDWKTHSNQFWNHYQSSETDAGDAITALTDNHRTQAAVFAKIHGETPPPPPSPTGGSNPVRTATPTTTTHVPTTHLLNTDHNNIDPPTNDHHVHTPVHIPPPVVDPGLPPRHTPGQVDPGIPQGPGTSQGTTLPSGPGLPGSVGTVGGGVGAMGGIGAVAGGALGGAAAAGLAAGGLNGGLNGLVPMGGVRGGLSASGVRGIGATSRMGVGSVLGRSSGATGGRAGAGGMSSRNGGRSGGSRGSRGRAGGRGAGAGAGRSGKDKKRQGDERDLFDDGADWIDDEDAAPGLLD